MSPKTLTLDDLLVLAEADSKELPQWLTNRKRIKYRRDLGEVVDSEEEEEEEDNLHGEGDINSQVGNLQNDGVADRGNNADNLQAARYAEVVAKANEKIC